MFRYFCLAFIFFSLNLAAQRNLAVQALNKYVDYCNLTNNYLRILQPELDRFNDAVDYTVRKNQQKEEWGNNHISEEDYLSGAEYWEILPKTVYNECIRFSSYLPVDEKKLLNAKINNIRDIIFSIDHHRKDSIAYYVDKKNYLKDFNHCYVILKRIEKLYVKYDSARTDITNSIQKIYNLKYNITANDYLQCIEKIKPAMQLCHKIQENLAKEDTTQLAGNAEKLDSMVQILIKNELKYLTGMPDKKNNMNPKGVFDEHDFANPHVQYVLLMDDFKKFLADCQSFLKSRSYPYSDWYTKCYYYYNERFTGTHSLPETYNLLNILVTGDKFFIIREDKPAFVSLRDFTYRYTGLIVPERYVLRWIGKSKIYRLRKSS